MEETIATEARLDDGMVAFGRWRSRLKGMWITGGIILGAALILPGFLIATELQFAFGEVAWLWLSVVGGVVPFLVMSSIGSTVARQAVRTRTPSAIARIAAQYHVDEEKLTELANLAGSLDSKTGIIGGIARQILSGP